MEKPYNSNFKKAKKEARELALQSGKLAFVYKGKDNLYYVSEEELNFDNDQVFMIHYSGKFMKLSIYEEIAARLRTQDNYRTSPFCEDVMNLFYKYYN